MKRISILTISVVLVVAASGMALMMTPASNAEAVQTSVATDGKKAPDFSLTTIDGKSLNLYDYKGKGVIINFWATWCPPCRAEIPDMIELQKEYESKGFSFIGIAVGDEEEKVKAFVSAQKMNYPVAMGSRELAASYGKFTKEGAIRGIPTSFVINGKGEIVDYFIGARDKATFTEAIKKAIAK
ncbi:MAG: TlpA family protein disulfide reductase [Chloroherpetonaceae bacterium]